MSESAFATQTSLATVTFTGRTRGKNSGPLPPATVDTRRRRAADSRSCLRVGEQDAQPGTDRRPHGRVPAQRFLHAAPLDPIRDPCRRQFDLELRGQAAGSQAGELAFQPGREDPTIRRPRTEHEFGNCGRPRMRSATESGERASKTNLESIRVSSRMPPDSREHPTAGALDAVAYRA